MHEVKLNIRYTGGDADNHKLNLYDAGASIHGLAKALAISTNALLKNGEIRSRTSSIPHTKFYLHPPRKGSFIELVSVFFDDPAVQLIGSSVIGAAFWDMLRFSWYGTSGKDPQPIERIPKKIIKENELFPSEMADALEKPLAQFQRPILNSSEMKIEVKRPRMGTIMTFDKDTLDHVSTIVDSGEKENIKGNVTKYNIITGYGKFYDDELKKTIPFNNSKDLSYKESNNLTWSMHNAGESWTGKILIDAKVTNDNTGNVRRYEITGVRKANETNS
ncbi:hypothetical protein QYS48_33070 [Marivirga arenosa]|uniref:Uncharacterized protein n=1 Tax=Marivirga arenosa TaxID=3059076 RepID=A0AA51N5W2_9BACT|nr:hypothetical protein [Marivirga sp. ABR2-2]WMN06613.1 hypothetical protein QYS48_33070 [Marivirga sp. ABR2-2]